MWSVATVNRVWGIGQRDERQLQRGSALLSYRLADELVSGYMPVIEEIDEAIDRIEEEVFDNPQPLLLERILGLKQASAIPSAHNRTAAGGAQQTGARRLCGVHRSVDAAVTDVGGHYSALCSDVGSGQEGVL
jgi:hypothetical protein